MYHKEQKLNHATFKQTIPPEEPEENIQDDEPPTKISNP